MSSEVREVQIETVSITGRYRHDLGDLGSLAKSIRTVGLIQPIVVTRDMRLIAGGRRLEACRRLGWTTIPAMVVNNLGDASLKLTAERDENTERKEMTWSELVALGKALEELERPKAAARKKAGKRLDHPGPPGTQTGRSPGSGDVREVVGKALGYAGVTYSRARAVVNAAEAEDATPAVKDIRDELDRTGNVAGAYNKLRGERSPVVGERPHVTIAAAGRQRQIISKAETALSGICHALGQITELHPGITSDEAAQWVGGLSNHRAVIERLIKRLKERTNEQA